MPTSVQMAGPDPEQAATQRQFWRLVDLDTLCSIDVEWAREAIANLENRASWAVTDWQRAQGGRCSVVMAGSVMLSYAVQLWRQQMGEQELMSQLWDMARLVLNDPEQAFVRMTQLSSVDVRALNAQANSASPAPTATGCAPGKDAEPLGCDPSGDAPSDPSGDPPFDGHLPEVTA